MTEPSDTSDPSEHSGSRWEPTDPVPAAQYDYPVEPIDASPVAVQPKPYAGRTPGRLVLAAGAVALLAAGVGGFVAGHAIAGSGQDGASVVDRGERDGQFPGTSPDGDGDRGQFPGTPPDLGEGGIPSIPDQGPGGDSDGGAGTGSAT